MLTVWTVIGAATGDADALDQGAAHGTGLALTIEQAGVAEIAIVASSVVDEVRIRRSAVNDRSAQDDSDRTMQTTQLPGR